MKGKWKKGQIVSSWCNYGKKELTNTHRNGRELKAV